MFTSGGQPDLWRCMTHGGGKGGGGGSYTPPAPIVLTDPVSGKTFTQAGNDYGTSAQDQLNAEISARQAQEKSDSDAATAKTNTDAATAESTFQTNRQSAYDNALQQVMRSFQLQGVDPQQYMASDITPALQKQYNSVQDLDPNPTAAFSDDLGTTIVNNVLGGKRTQALNQVNSTFNPTYSSTALPDNLIDQNMGSVISSQFDPLQAQLTNAQKRGTLSGAGYDAAETALKNKQTAAQATVRNLGQGILSADRSGIDNYISGARTDANNLTLAGSFDPTQYASGAQSKVAGYTDSFGGALQNAVGDTQFATIGDLINAGGALQGTLNPTASNPAGKPTTAAGGGPLSPAYVDPDVANAQKRGLGNTGAF